MDTISVIVPCYNEQAAIEIFYDAICGVAEKMKSDVDFEVVFVDDGSKDESLSIMKKLADKDSRVRYISFSRNFGKEGAMLAGLEAVKGDFVSLMDVDLQDPPELLMDMYKTVKSGRCDCVAARRATRKGEPIIRSFFSNMFYKFINKISDTEFVSGARDFRLMTRQMVDSILSLKEYNRFSKGIFSWVGYKTEWISYDNVERSAGETKWSFWKLLKYSLEGIVAFSTKPLAIASFLGIFFLLLAVLLIIFVIIKTLVFGDPTTGYPSMLCIILLLSGIQLFSVGVLGQYLSRMYLEIKNRPVYITKESNINK